MLRESTLQIGSRCAAPIRRERGDSQRANSQRPGDVMSRAYDGYSTESTVTTRRPTGADLGQGSGRRERPVGGDSARIASFRS